MLQVMCSRDTKRICDGSCDDPGCMAKHRPTVTISCAGCDMLREALYDLLSWFPDAPSPPEWRLKGGEHGADDAIAHAREVLGVPPNYSSTPK